MELFEELVACFGLRMDGGDASQDVINLYPVEVIVWGGRGERSTMSLLYMVDGGGSCGDGTDGIPQG
jgi:hypothetical protein